ncbi:MAG TPA: nucleotide exchange factor GrpE [Candidatus Binataceae bacterium]|nr:nucleotide exchange factor GrpE [Candidatus Binataceae bacterium]
MNKRINDVDNPARENVSPDGPADKDIELTPDQEVKPEHAEAPNSMIEKLQAQIAEKDKELAELKDRYLRALADGENARKRIRQQSEDSVRLQRENLLRELLPVVDNLERAVDAARGGGNGKPIVEGVEMVLRSMLDFLKTHGVTQLTSVGQPFDPQRHEAVDQIESSQHPPNTIVNEFHRGYQIGDRLLRPARVAVAKGTSSNNGGRHGDGADGDDVESP